MTVDDDGAVCTGGAIRNPYAEAAPELYRMGLFPIPVDAKRPCVQGFTKSGRRSRDVIDKWCVRYATANVGLVTGGIWALRLVVADLDDPAQEAEARTRFGNTPLVARTPSGGVHLYYRHSGERCHNLRRYGLKVDVKGTGGFVVVAPSFNRETLRPYRFESGSWADLRNLPTMRKGALDFTGRDIALPTNNVVSVASIPEGQRNGKLFSEVLKAAKKQGTTFEALLAFAYEMNAKHCAVPLPAEEVQRVVLSAWRMTERGDNWTGKEQRVILTRTDLELLAAQPHGAEALMLYAKLKLSHEAEPNKRFAVAPKAMSKNAVLPGWTPERIRKGRDALVQTGHLRLVRKGGRGAHDPHQYELALPLANPEGLRIPTQYNVTPRPASAPPSPVGLGELATAGTTTPATPDFGAWVRAERQRRGLRQLDVAKKAGLSRPALANIEVGRFGASAQARERLRAALGVAA